MNLTTNSRLLISFFIKNDFLNHAKLTKNTKKIIRVLYDDIINAYNFIKGQKNIYNIQVNKINSISNIPRPKTFDINSVPDKIRKHIDNESLTEICYTFSLYNRNVIIKFIVENNTLDINLDIYNNYVETIIMWFYILNKYSSHKCSRVVTIYLYLTSLIKTLPNNHTDILNRNNVNTAFTSSCRYNTEIVIFRNEEWFKVLLHETFHSFGLDFSDMNNNECNKLILSIFKVSSEVNLFEAYVEFWAEIINSLFCSFFIIKNKDNFDSFLLNAEFFINVERTHSFFQMVKTLNFMGLKYVDLYSKKQEINTLYKERTSILSYYIIKLILINNFQGFLEWCNIYNSSLLQFKKTIQNQKQFCEFIRNNYKNKSLIKDITHAETFLNKLNLKKKGNEYLLTNMRMSICELG